MAATRLLETGHTPLIRNTAAQQLTDVQKSHPDELFNLLHRIVPFLSYKSWETRTAAAKALGGIAENTAQYDPNEDEADIKEETSNGNGYLSDNQSKSAPLSFAGLNLRAILQYGVLLLRDGGKDYEVKFVNLSPAERLKLEQTTLRSRLGLNGKYTEPVIAPIVNAPRLPVPIHTSSFHNHVSSAQKSEPITSNGSPRSPDVPSQTDEPKPSTLSSRQLNALKRKKKLEMKTQVNKVRVVDFSERKTSISDVPETPIAPQPTAIKTGVKMEEEDNGIAGYFSTDRTGSDDDTKLVKEFKGEATVMESTFATAAEQDGSEWPFERVCEFLAVDLFDHRWEVRHGAAMGLREILRVHGSGAGRVRGRSRKQNDKLNRQWLNDVACRVCCVFVLDRYIDFAADTAVAPVRESSAQALAVVLKHMPAESVIDVFRFLRELVMNDDLTQVLDTIWQPRHGALLGMRYMVSTRDDLLDQEPELLDGVLDCTMRGLQNSDDDIRAVSAATLTPIAKDIVLNKDHLIDNLVLIVWNSLTDLNDDLSASTGHIMDLLAKLCSFSQVLHAMKRNAAQDDRVSFTNLVPRLFPFLRHTITSVRAAVLRALLTFLSIPGPEAKQWVNGLALRLIFQNTLLERNDEVLELSLQVWTVLVSTLEASGQFVQEIAPHVDALVKLTLHPVGVQRHPIPMDVGLFLKPSGEAYIRPQVAPRRASPINGSETQSKKRRRSAKAQQEEKNSWESRSHNIDGPAMQGDIDLVGADAIMRNKLMTARALGLAMSAWPTATRTQIFGPKLLAELKSTYGSTQLFAGLVILEFSRSSPRDELSAMLVQALLLIIDEERPPYYTELTCYLYVVRTKCQEMLNIFQTQAHVPASKLPAMAAVVQGDKNASSKYAFGIVDGEKIIGQDYENLWKRLNAVHRKGVEASLPEARADVSKYLEDAKLAKERRDIRVKAVAAAALIGLDALPKKPALVIKAVMDSVKTEDNYDIQQSSAAAIARLVEHMVMLSKKTIVDKVVGNLVKFYCSETAETPEFHANASITDGILSLRKEEDVKDHPDAARFEKEARAARIMRRGSKEALEQLVITFGTDLFDRLPSLRDIIEKPLKTVFETEEVPSDLSNDENDLGTQVIDAISTLRALVPKFDPALDSFTFGLFTFLARALRSKLAVFRYIAAKCFSTICSVKQVEGISMLVDNIIPLISNPLNVSCRQGAMECIYHLIHVMEDGILPYVIFLIVPVLGRMSDSDHDVRLIAATTFATLVKLVPLEAGIPDPPGFSDEMLKGRERERNFINQMLDPKKADNFQIPVAIKAELRPYQQDGVNWLAFLNRYNLHGILCDDMGLGKTLQTLCIVASDHHLRAEEYEKSRDPDARKLPSIIVCPPTLSGHWAQEIAQFAPFLTAVSYTGSTADRIKNRMLLEGADIVITSYDVCRNDVSVLGPINWNYCVLDEGHLIKNPRTKTTQAVKSLKSYHRLILSGTPIQNNVLELWSLFDFLMPGFLGSEKVFQDRFAKPIAASRNAKSSSKEQEVGALAIESLHKQVLPFLLRRLKEEVLNDLPPKIVQNYYCDLSDLQRKLFDDFGKAEKTRVAEAAADKSVEGQRHIFQALQYMRKLCNSPALVVKKEHKKYDQIVQSLAAKKTSLTDIVHAPKLMALRDLLVDCGIGTVDVESQSGFAAAEAGAVSQHRALIFCQMKEMLDMVQTQVFQQLLPSVQYLRLDGSVETSKRQEIVNRFNSDASYDCLLLTTSVGGLGLNLTGADTVIFVEHDWNPQKDMQAMDRAHRIGQKKVVNVYRIVTRNTLEEKILSLQRFKIDVASTVVNQQNSALGSMETDQLLDLFNISSAQGAPPLFDGSGANRADGISEEDAVDATGEMRTKGQRHVLDDMTALWDEKQYAEEYNLDAFLASMKA